MLKNIGHGSIRKIKGGAAGVIALSTIFLGATAVSANETDVEVKPEVGVSTKVEEKGTEAKPTAPEVVKEVEGTKKQEPQLQVKEEKAEAKDDKVVKEVPKETSTESFKKAESKEFDIAKADAKENGVSVKEDTKPAIKNSDAEAQQDLAKQTKDLKSAQKTQVGSDAITGLDKEKLNEAGIKVVDGKVKVFTDLKGIENFVKQQSKDIAADIETKHNADNSVQLATKELKEAGIEVVMGKEVVKASSKEALQSLKELQERVSVALKTKHDLDSAFLALQERAKSEGILTKEGKVLTLKDAKEAKEFMEKQTKEVNELISSLKQENTKLLTAIANAESYGVTVSKGTIKTAPLKEATEHISKQVEELNQLVKSVEGSKALISTALEKATKEGVNFDGENVINSAKGETNLNEKVSSAVKELSEAVKAQTTAKQELLALIQGAKAKGLEVNISGNKKVMVSGVSAELATIKAQVEDALSKQAKAQADYQSALAKAQSAGRLLDGSTAKQEGNVYKQTLVIKSEGTGGMVDITTTGSANLVSVELIDPTGAKVESVKTLADLKAYTGFNKKGDYKVNYTFTAKDNTSGSITSTANVKGTEAVNGSVTGKLDFATKASVTTSKETKPRSIFAIIDNSGSVNGGSDSRIRSSFIPLLQTMGANDQIQIATYGINQKTSYFSNGADDRERMVTKMMNRDEFAKLAEEVLADKTGTTREAILNQKLVYDFKGVKQSGSRYEFEDIFDAARNKDYTPVVMQFTDSWEYEEDIDSSFAEWSKAHAKTFMSVIYGSGRAEVAMKKAGHPNIFLANGEFTTDSDQTKKVLEQIKATTTEVVKKGANQTVNVSIGGQGVTVTKATLKGAANKELAIKDGKVDFSEKLADGNYSVEFVVEGNGTVTTVVTIDGKEVTKKLADVKSTAGSKGSSATVTDKLNALVLPTAPKGQPITVNDITVVAKKPVLGTVESEVATVTTEKELNKVTFKETVAPISFERTVTPAQAEVTTHDVYVKSAKAVKTLPNTGTADSSMTQVAGAGLGLIGLLSLYGLKRKED